jgi:hypothetical protein
MNSWRERLCGTVALKSVNEATVPSISQLLDPTTALSCGGQNQLPQNQSTTFSKFKKNFILPTDFYSVLVFNKEGSAVIYSDNSDNQQEVGEEMDYVEAAASPEGMKIYH